MWLDTTVPLLRSIIQDISVNPDYSNARLIDVLFSAAHLILSEITFDNAYTVNLLTRVIDPDPVTSSDISFVNMVVYKSALLILSSELKTSASQGVIIKDGPSTVDIRGNFSNQKARYDLMSKEYDKVKMQIKMGDLHSGHAVLNPYTRPNDAPYIWR